MAEAIGIAAGTLQFLSFATGSLSVFQEFKNNTPESYRTLGFKLEAEAVKFREWCDILGVQNMIAATKRDPNGWQASRDIREFEHQLQKLLRFDNERMAGMIIQALQDMEQSFRKARLKIAPAYNDLNTELQPRRRRSIKRLFRSRKPPSPGPLLSPPTSPFQPTSPSTSSLATRGSGLLSSTKWVLLDRKEFKSLLEDIITINECLSTFLADDAKAKLRRRVQVDMIRTPGLDVGDAADLLPGDREVHTMAVLAKKLQTITEEEDQLDNPQENLGEIQKLSGNHASGVHKTPSSCILDVDDFDSGSLEFGPSRAVSSLAKRPVLVEWTHYAKSINLDHFSRRGNLVRLLNNDGIYRKFQTLPSKGIVMDSKNSRIGLVFEIPGKAGTTVQEKSLLDLVERQSPLPLGHRFAMAKALSMAIYSLQSVNWLHKSIRSDNLVYFKDTLRQPEPGAQNKDIARPKDKDHPQTAFNNRPPNPPDLFLMGWHLSRSSHPSELSQSLSISTRGYTLTQELIRLSSHPASLPAEPSSSPRPCFKPEYDIYSFGLVLLEIGLWESLPFVRQRCQSDEDFREQVKGKYCDRLLPKMGVIYWEATRRCLWNDFDRAPREGMGFDDVDAGADGGVGGGGEASLVRAFERQVVSELERCVA